MKREIRFGITALPRKPLWGLIAWSVPEALPPAISGYALARAVDSGFLVDRPMVGLAWLGTIMLAALVGAAASHRVFGHLGDLVEPFRDTLVRRVVVGSLHRSVAGQADDGALARLTRQIEIVRDTYGGLLVVVRTFVITVAGVLIGVLSIAPIIALLILPPFVLGLGAFLAILGLAATRQRASVLADERLATSASSVLGATRDVVATGAEEHAMAMVDGPIADQARVERSLAGVAALRAFCFVIGGWTPLLILLFAGPWLVDQGLTTGAIMGGLTYVLVGIQPALGTFFTGVGNSGLRYVITLGRILDATAPTSPVVLGTSAPPPAEVRTG